MEILINQPIYQAPAASFADIDALRLVGNPLLSVFRIRMSKTTNGTKECANRVCLERKPQ